MTTESTAHLQRTLAELGATVIERDWLSSNHTVFKASGGRGAAVVDTGYDRHGPMSVALIERALAGEPLARIVNTHLHSDHCGGNLHLQQCHHAETWVPQPSLAAVQAWDQAALSFDGLDQHCQRFRAEQALVPGSSIELGPCAWQVLAAPGHDPHAVMLFEPHTRVLISGDALWERGVAIIFPELDGASGFAQAQHSLHVIEQLAPTLVIPGHGRPFTDVAAALAQSRARLERWRAEPQAHLRYGVRALVVFHMLAVQRMPLAELLAWMERAPLMQRMTSEFSTRQVVDGLVRDGALMRQDDEVFVP